MTDTKTTEFSAELKALLASKGIATEQPAHTPEAVEWLELEAAYQKEDKLHNSMVLSSSMDYSRYSSHEEALRAIGDRIEYLRDRAAAVTKSLELAAQMQEAITTRNLRQAAIDSENTRSAWRDSLREVIAEADREHAAKYGTPYARFEKALSEIAKAGILVKKSRRNLWKIAEGVPVMYAPEGWGEGDGYICFQQMNLFDNGEPTAAGKRVISRFEIESLKVQVDTDSRGQSSIYVRLRHSRAAYSRPEIAELSEYLETRWW